MAVILGVQNSSGYHAIIALSVCDSSYLPEVISNRNVNEGLLKLFF